jgi:hypothetical protein
VVIRVDVHPTARIAAIAVVVAIAGSLALLGLKQLVVGKGVSGGSTVEQGQAGSGLASCEDLLLSVIALDLPDAQLESSWSSALAATLRGQTEAPVEGGRVDVLTSLYAIEVERLEKWHEAIGQSAHYGIKTGKQPVAAIMIASDLWPLSATTRDKLRLIDETCTKQGIKLLLLRRRGP